MNALVLGGNNPQQHEWVRQAAGALMPHFRDVRFLDYRHWSESHKEAHIDGDYELHQAAQLADDFDRYIIVAKSIGTVLATLGTARRLLRPEYCLFLGFPLGTVQERIPEVATALPHLPLTTFLHHEHDPVGSSTDVAVYLAANAPLLYRLEVLPGDTHSYTEFDVIVRLAVEAAAASN